LVPPGWSVIEEEEDSLLLGSDNEDAVVGIMVFDSEGRSLKQSARALSSELGGNEPELDDDIYRFAFSDDGVDAVAFVGEADKEDRFITIFLFGDIKTPGVKEILDSLEGL
jgi:hypothetical protein